jgi:hypothetical protein
MHRCSREKKKDSKHARVSVQVLALALGTLYSVLHVLYILSSYARRRASLFLRRRRLLVAGESGVRQCDGAACGVRGVRQWRAVRCAACGSGVRRRWRGGCGGNGKALYFNAAPYIYSATHSVSLTSTTRLQNRVAL